MPPVRVLVVEDNAVQRLSICAWLSNIAGLSVIGDAACGSDALAGIDKARPDLVLTDVEMPGIDGFDLTRRLKTMPNPPRVVIMSASDTPDYTELARHAGAETFICKHSLHDKLAHFLAMEFGLQPRAQRS